MTTSGQLPHCQPICSKDQGHLWQNSSESVSKNDLNFILNQYQRKTEEMHTSQLNYEKLIESLYARISNLTSDLSLLSIENQTLQEEKKNLKTEYSISLQTIQEKNELKAKSHKENLDLLLKDMNNKTVFAIAEKYNYDYEAWKHKCKQEFDHELESAKNLFEKKLRKQENDHQELITNLKNYHSCKIKRLENASKALILKVSQQTELFRPSVTMSEAISQIFEIL